jgi:hypothetical protein
MPGPDPVVRRVHGGHRFAPVLIARGGSAAAPPAQPGPVQTTGPCRTADTAVTSVTVAGPMRDARDPACSIPGRCAW